MEKTIDPGRIRRLLIRSTNWIGDAIMTTPAVRALRRNLPEAQITILTKPWVAPVFENSAHVDAVMLYQSEGRHKGMTGKLRLIQELRQYRFDAALLLQNAFEAALIAFLTQVPCRIGYATDGRKWLLTHPLNRRPALKKVHQTQYYLNLLNVFGFHDDHFDLYLRLEDGIRNRAQELLEAHGVGLNAPLVGINPSAAYGPAKQWLPERYAELADRIHELLGAQILLFGGPEDGPFGRQIAQMMRHAPVNLAGKTLLKEAMALIEKCRILITNDSGLMHVAAALKVPLVAIFGSTDFRATGPLSPQSRVIRVPVDCSPCLQPECPEGHLNCMDRIDVETVFRAVEELM